MKKPDTIVAPFAGWSAPLTEIPDAVFAQAMLGEGAAIDPLGQELRSPCDGEIISVAAARHALGLRTPAGAEILVHVGIDTVSLDGEGFEVHVRKGERVKAGDLLLRFDLDALARRAPSMLTPIIVTNGERFRIRRAHVHRAVRAGDPLLELEEIGASAALACGGATPLVSEALVVSHAHGIHARPAAMIARAAKQQPSEIEIRAHGRAASARSAVALMSLGVRGGDEVVIVAFDPGAQAGVEAIARVIRGLEDVAAPSPTAAATPASAVPGRLRGVRASGGLAVGPAFCLQAMEPSVSEDGRGAETEAVALERALAATRVRLANHAATAAPTVRDILAAHLELLEDPQVLQQARRQISAGRSAAFAWRQALRCSQQALESTGDPHLAERIDDLRDLELQVLRELGAVSQVRTDVPEGGILVARDLAPSQFIDLDHRRLGGIALAAGGPTSHVAILAGSAGVPMLVALGPELLEVPAGQVVVLDGDAATLQVAPTLAEVAEARQRVATERAARDHQRALAQRPCHLASGERLEVFANLAGTVADAEQAVAQGAEGCGLLRTEFLFLERATPPDEDEQLRCYQQVAHVLGADGGQRPLIIRTLDVGGDKPIPYLPMPPEDNPALGLRGIRTSFWRPDVFDAQLRALLRLASSADCRILLPMITDAEELREVRARLERLRVSLGVAMPKLGAMIETPAAAVMADRLAQESDFLSIGTNDLTQYTLAMDRGHAELAPRIDGLHPAVLALVERVGAAGQRHGKLVAVCGGLAADPVAAPILVGLGVRELSVVPNAIPALKERLSRLTLEGCRALALQALAQESAAAVRKLAGANA